jgi:hypothetical protein
MAEVPGTRRMIEAVLPPSAGGTWLTPGVAREAKTLGESSRGQQNQSTVPSVVTSLGLQVTNQPVVAGTGIAVHVRPLHVVRRGQCPLV